MAPEPPGTVIDESAAIGLVSKGEHGLVAAERRGRDAERLYRSRLMRTGEAVCVIDAHGMVSYLSQSSEPALGYSPEEVMGTVGFDLAHPDDAASLRSALADAVADPSARPVVVYRARARDGSWHWQEMRLSNHLDDPNIAGIVCNVGDAAEQHALVRELQTADARQRAIVARSRDATLFMDVDGTIRWASPVAPGLLGVVPSALIGQVGLDFVHEEDRERVFAEFASIPRLGDHVRTEFRIVDPTGRVRWIEEDATNLVEDLDVLYVVANIRDITDRKRDQEELEQLALHDRLTGLPNRSLLVDRLEQLLTRGNAATVLYIDIDNMRDINDSLGHAVGDEVLRLIGGRFRGATIHSDWTVARIGGDEFVLLCANLRDATAALSYADRLRHALKLPLQLDGQEIFATASIGVALSPVNPAVARSHADQVRARVGLPVALDAQVPTGSVTSASAHADATRLMRDAGTAMRQAKRQGRDRVVIFDAGLDHTQRHRLVIQGELRRALARDELVVWYQPVIDLRTHRIAGVEGLVRWNHPQQGLLGPDLFIDIAETSGLIRSLGSQVLRQACADAHTWRERGCVLQMSVNAAAAQLSSLDYVDEIEAALEEFDLGPDQLTIEITETAVMQVANSLDTLQRIRRLGAHLSLDDFGTGYSSLSFLRELPVDAIKIDRSFVSGLGTDPCDASIVRGIIGMASALNLDVVAEGVETLAQAEALQALGCSYAQGYLWSRPVPAVDIQDLIDRINRSDTPKSARSSAFSLPPTQGGWLQGRWASEVATRKKA